MLGRHFFFHDAEGSHHRQDFSRRRLGDDIVRIPRVQPFYQLGESAFLPLCQCLGARFGGVLAVRFHYDVQRAVVFGCETAGDCRENEQ